MWLKTSRPPCQVPSSAWYCGESATRHAGSHVAETEFVPTIQPTTGSLTIQVGPIDAVHAGSAPASEAAVPAAIAAARNVIRANRGIRDRLVMAWACR